MVSTACKFDKLNTSATRAMHQLIHLSADSARDFDATLYYNAMIAHASIGKLFDLPVVLSTSAENGPNGPLPKAILDMYPDAPLIKRQGEVDAWDNPEFRKAIEATGKKQVIMAGITTDVCE
jgi:hypothetical protein